MAGHAGLVLLRGVVPALDGLGPRAPGPCRHDLPRWSGWSGEGILVRLVEAGGPVMGEPCVSG